MPRLHITIVIALVLGFAQLSPARITAPDSDTDRVADQFREFCLQESTDHGKRLLDDVEMPTASDSQIDRYGSSLKPDGSWPDLDYASKARSAWQPGTHLTRMLAIVVRARQTGIDPALAKKDIEAVHRAMGYWAAHDFKCPNWWYNDIGVPKLLGNIALLMGNDLQPPELEYITRTAMARSKVGSMTGQNRVWLAGNGIMRAALMHDGELLKKAADVIADEIRVTDKEGVQPDWSFHQHGPQLQFGNYGMAFAVEMTKWATVLRGTPYAFNNEKLIVLGNYLLQGQNWITWHGEMDISSCGRQLFPETQEKKAGVIRGVFRSMIKADPEHAADYQAFVDRNSGDRSREPQGDLLGDKVFWRSDYLVHRTADSMVSLKMSSNRVIGGETVNDENRSGLHLADGAMFIYRTGHEYDDIFPVWNWRMIPGTTEAADESPLIWTGNAEHLSNPFAGGASDGRSAVCALDFHRGNLAAKKAWFFTNRCIVCLGADITSTQNVPVVTTLDQCLLTGPVTIQETGKKPAIYASSGALPRGTDWVEHAGTRYIFPSPQSASLSQSPRQGNWRVVFQNPSTPKEDVTEKVFTLSIDHGTDPKAAMYAYAVASAGMDPKFKVVRNSGSLQAVDIGPGWSAVVFWLPGSIEMGGKTIAADHPCVLLDNDGKMTVADPTEELKSLKLTIAGKEETIILPQAGDAGKSVSVP